MFQLFSPLALVALVSLAIPLLLHLWRPPAKTVRIGTLQFFTGPAVRRLTKLQWRERLLLLVRLLLLSTLVLLLARPIWNRPPPTTPQRWVLVEPGVPLEGAASERVRVLEREGYERRALAAGFPREAALTAERNRPPDLWSLLREADARLPAGSEIAAVTSARIAALRGERPALRSKVELISVAPTDEPEQSLVSLHRADAGELQGVVESSDATKTVRTCVTVASAPGLHRLPAPLDHLSIEVRLTEGGNISARLGPGDGVAATTRSPLNVVILHAGDRVEDARYIAAATRTLPAADVRVEPMGGAPDVSNANWIVWLSDEAVPPPMLAEVTTRGADLLQDAEGSRDAHDALGADAMTFDRAQPVALLRRIAPTGTGAAVWRDNLGRPLLTVDRIGRGRHWRFFSRFRHDWNDLPRSSALAAALQSLLVDHEADSAADLRRADVTQAAPAQASAERDSPGTVHTPAERVDLKELLWTIAALLFAAERALSYRSARPSAMTIPARRREEAPVLAGDTR